MILVTSADPDLAVEILELLRFEGFEVSVQADCALAFEQTVSQKPDLIIIGYPETTLECLTFIQNVRQTESIRNTPMLLLTTLEGKVPLSPNRNTYFHDTKKTLATEVRGLLPH